MSGPLRGVPEPAKCRRYKCGTGHLRGGFLSSEAKQSHLSTRLFAWARLLRFARNDGGGGPEELGTDQELI